MDINELEQRLSNNYNVYLSPFLISSSNPVFSMYWRISSSPIQSSVSSMHTLILACSYNTQ